MSQSGRRGGGRRDAAGRGGGGFKRGLSVKVKTAKGRSAASTKWLRRQLNDPYVAEARRRGYRSRAAFKLAEIDDKCRILRRGAQVVDLGCAPGGWLQVAVERVGPGGRIVGIDLLPVDPLPGALLLQGDFLEDEALDRLRAALDGPVDVVLSDMAASATGHAGTDHLRVMALAEAAWDFARQVLAPGGGFVAKVLQGGSEGTLLQALKRDFVKVRHIKPPASRQDSAELYVVATGFRGHAEGETA